MLTTQMSRWLVNTVTKLCGLRIDRRVPTSLTTKIEILHQIKPSFPPGKLNSHHRDLHELRAFFHTPQKVRVENTAGKDNITKYWGILPTFRCVESEKGTWILYPSANSGKRGKRDCKHRVCFPAIFYFSKNGPAVERLAKCANSEMCRVSFQACKIEHDGWKIVRWLCAASWVYSFQRAICAHVPFPCIRAASQAAGWAYAMSPALMPICAVECVSEVFFYTSAPCRSGLITWKQMSMR